VRECGGSARERGVSRLGIFFISKMKERRECEGGCFLETYVCTGGESVFVALFVCLFVCVWANVEIECNYPMHRQSDPHRSRKDERKARSTSMDRASKRRCRSLELRERGGGGGQRRVIVVCTCGVLLCVCVVRTERKSASTGDETEGEASLLATASTSSLASLASLKDIYGRSSLRGLGLPKPRGRRRRLGLGRVWVGSFRGRPWLPRWCSIS